MCYLRNLLVLYGIVCRGCGFLNNLFILFEIAIRRHNVYTKSTGYERSPRHGDRIGVTHSGVCSRRSFYMDEKGQCNEQRDSNF